LKEQKLWFITLCYFLASWGRRCQGWWSPNKHFNSTRSSLKIILFGLWFKKTKTQHRLYERVKNGTLPSFFKSYILSCFDRIWFFEIIPKNNPKNTAIKIEAKAKTNVFGNVLLIISITEDDLSFSPSQGESYTEPSFSTLLVVNTLGNDSFFITIQG
jgi:hypothetical protein